MKYVNNMSVLDRTIRIIAGSALIYLGLFYGDLTSYKTVNYLVALIGLFNVLAGSFSHCPLYTLADISSRKTQKNKE